MKISIIGAGNVGSSLAFLLASRGFADIVLIDVLDNFAKAKALDIKEAMPIFGYDLKINGSGSYEGTINSDIIVITAGLPRKPGMKREDLLEANAKILSSVIENIKKSSPNAILIVVTNPLDAMAHLARKLTGFERGRVIGMAGTLDSSRLRFFIAEETGASVNDVEAVVLGSHGNAMVPVISAAKVKNKLLSSMLNNEKISRIVEKTRNAGADIVNLAGTSSYYAPAAAIYELIESIALDKKRTLPCSVYLEGEYGMKGIFFGVPARLGKGGVEGVIELNLAEEEKKQLASAADAIKKLVSALRF